ncbi:MAG: ATP-binding protein [Gemmatimonadetes bacterium]|nr:MAG: ATP-binding protein [Gemmatimonadota bacterium]
MPLNIRTYHELTEPDRSGLPGQIAAQRRRVAARLAGVGRVVAVMSGKGGVGKSFATAGLARALARAGRAAGVLDADFNGPTIPALLSLPVARCTLHEDGIEPAVSAEGVRCFSMALLLEDGRPLGFRGPEADSHVWRETLEAAALREFLADVAWGPLDRLLVDLPPGIQRFQELAGLLPAPPAVLTVTIPTAESRDAVRRAMQFARERRAELLGVVENMVDGPFAGGAGEDLAREFGVPLLARIPWHPTPDVWEAVARRLEGGS